MLLGHGLDKKPLDLQNQDKCDLADYQLYKNDAFTVPPPPPRIHISSIMMTTKSLPSHLHPFFVSCCDARVGTTVSGLQSQVQSLRENVGKVSEERNGLKRDLDQKVQELQERVNTIIQVKKIGRRYKTQYDDLKAEHDKVTEQTFQEWDEGMPWS